MAARPASPRPGSTRSSTRPSRCASTPSSSAACRGTSSRVQREMELRIGETGLAFYEAHNPTDRPIAGQASYNVAPVLGRRLLRQDRLFLLHRAGAAARRDGADAGHLLRRSRRSSTTARRSTSSTITLSYTFHEIDLGRPRSQNRPRSAAPDAARRPTSNRQPRGTSTMAHEKNHDYHILNPVDLAVHRRGRRPSSCCSARCSGCTDSGALDVPDRLGRSCSTPCTAGGPRRDRREARRATTRRSCGSACATASSCSSCPR